MLVTDAVLWISPCILLLFLKLNMVCDGAVMKSTGQMVFFGGVFAGALLTGMISDR